VIGPSFAADEVPDVIEALIDTYRAHRVEHERFIDTARRIGVPAFRTAADATRRATAHAEVTA
jgi:sulfite reductase (NADPH) hemoprotein beta-component